MLTDNEKKIIHRLRTILQNFMPYKDQSSYIDERREIILPSSVHYTRRYRVFIRWLRDTGSSNTPRVQYDIEAIHAKDMNTIPLNMEETYHFKKDGGDLVFNVHGKDRAARKYQRVQWTTTQKMHGCSIQYVMFELRTALVQFLIENIISIYCPRGYGVKCEFMSTGTDVLNMTLHSDYDMTLSALHKTSYIISIYHRILKRLFNGRTSIEVLDNNLFGHSFMQTHMMCRTLQGKKCQKSQVIKPHWRFATIGPREFVLPNIYNAKLYCHEQESWALLRMYVHIRELFNHRRLHTSLKRRMSSRKLSRQASGSTISHGVHTPSSMSFDISTIAIWPKLHVHLDKDSGTCSFLENLDTAEKFYQANPLADSIKAKKYVERMDVYEKLRYIIESKTTHSLRKIPEHPTQFNVLSHMNYFGDETYFSAAPLLHVVGMMMLMADSPNKDKFSLVKTANMHIMWDSFLHSMIENASYWIHHILDESDKKTYLHMPVKQIRRYKMFLYAKYLLRFFDAMYMHSIHKPCTSVSAQRELKALVELLSFIKKEVYNRSNTVIQLRRKARNPGAPLSNCEVYKQELYDKVMHHVARVIDDRKPQPTLMWLLRSVCRLLESRCKMAITADSLLVSEVPKLCKCILEYAKRYTPSDMPIANTKTRRSSAITSTRHSRKTIVN